VRPAVVNASPLIVLARAGYLDLLPKLFSLIRVPRGVVHEVNAGPTDEPLRRLLNGKDWLSIVDLEPLLSPLATARLGRGETEVLEFARTHEGTVALLDDKAARRAAAILNIPVIGSLGVLAAASRAGFLPNFDTGAEALVRAGLYVDPAIVAELAARLRQRP
jgi:predicted nucleic acid-binding protein